MEWAQTGHAVRMLRAREDDAKIAPVPHSARMVPHIMARPGVNTGSRRMPRTCSLSSKCLECSCDSRNAFLTLFPEVWQRLRSLQTQHPSSQLAQSTSDDFVSSAGLAQADDNALQSCCESMLGCSCDMGNLSISIVWYSLSFCV